MSNFEFSKAGWPAISEEARRAEHYAYGDPRSSLFYARRALELTVHWLYHVDESLHAPYNGTELSALMFEPTFKNLVGQAVLAKMTVIRKRGNDAAHKIQPMTDTESLPVVRELFHVLIWLATHYAASVEQRPPADTIFDVTVIPRPTPGAAAKTRLQLEKLAEENSAKDALLVLARSENVVLAAELAALRVAIATAKAANAVVPDTHDYREAETRHLFIDLLLAEAGWPLTDERDREFPVTGMPRGPLAKADDPGAGFADYVLWGNDGLPLAVVEAKRTTRDPRAGQEQARLYADALERQFGQRPVIFYTNGYEHHIWDDASYAPRQVSGFYTKDQLMLLVQRRTSKRPLIAEGINNDIAGRHYQIQAVTKIAESFERDNERKALLVMATGSGKTRTVIALADLLMRANWAKRVLFLADRIALVNQAATAFKEFLPNAAPVNLLTDRDSDGRVFVSTYGTIMGLIDQGGTDGPGALRRFGPGYFDLIITDEAHRSVYQKYGEIFSYFDSLLVGLTATPKDEVDHNTYSLFNLEDGVPTDSYELAQAIADGYLVPPVARPISLGFMARGIRYDDLSADERDQWDLLDWDDGLIPEEIDAAAVNKWLFNADTVDKVLEVLMTEGRKVASGDRLGKTIVFAKNNAHAEFIEERFNANYPEYAGKFARVVTYKTEFAQNVINDFSRPESAPHIAISVDMLDTGIDVPDVVNLVFFKPVYSKTKYWQMIGRGTRLRPDLYGPNAPKKDFVIFDVCGNIAFFNVEMADSGAGAAEPLGQRSFKARISLLRALDTITAPDADQVALRESLAGRMHSTVAGMNHGNFLVRRHLRQVERFAEATAWLTASAADWETAAEHLSGLPSAVYATDTDEKAKRFDLLALKAQLGVISLDAADVGAFVKAQLLIRAIADALGEQRNIPLVQQNLELIQAVASEEWWEGVTVAMLELMRLRLRGLVHLVDKTKQAIVYTDFEDTLDDLEDLEIHIASPGVDRERFREKLLAFLREHQDQAVLHKLRMGRQLTALDLSELERILTETGGFTATDLAEGVAEAHGLGLFIRSVAGMDRQAASDALDTFVGDATLTGNQLAFVRLIIDQLTQRGSVDAELLYEAPFTDFAPRGLKHLFSEEQVANLLGVLRHVSETAEAS